MKIVIFGLIARWLYFQIKGSREYKQSVANQVHQILKLTLPESWQFCLGSLNPADLGTCSVSATKLRDNTLWWDGPHFYRKSMISGWKASQLQYQTKKY